MLWLTNGEDDGRTFQAEKTFAKTQSWRTRLGETPIGGVRWPAVGMRTS